MKKQTKQMNQPKQRGGTDRAISSVTLNDILSRSLSGIDSTAL